MVVQVGRGGVEGGVGCGGEGVVLSLAAWLVAPVAAVETRRDHSSCPESLCGDFLYIAVLVIGAIRWSRD